MVVLLSLVDHVSSIAEIEQRVGCLGNRPHMFPSQPRTLRVGEGPFVCVYGQGGAPEGGARSTPLRGLVYQVLPEEQTVKVLRMWTHYE